MLQALLRGKLSRDQENAEDLLTSSVFGLLSYLPPEQGLLPFLAQAQSIDGNRALSWLVEPKAAPTSVTFDFWPFWDEAGCICCEPDLVIRLSFGDGRKVVLLVEAKLRSGKSSIAHDSDNPPNDQLAREWDNLVLVAARDQADAYLVYLTAHLRVPRSDIAESVAEYQLKRQDDKRVPRILALSWRELKPALQGSDSQIAKDLCTLCDRFDFKYFDGFHFGLAISSLEWAWHFSRWPDRWSALDTPPVISWRFIR